MLRVAHYFQKTDPGRQRRSNEDNVFARPPVFAVADGMGGARAGEVASKMVVEAFEDGLPDGGSGEERLARRVREANVRIHELAQSDPRRAGMGTTMTAAYVGEDVVSIAHVGDSRAYRMRDGELEQVTRDHSLVGELVRRGKLTEEEAEEHPQRSVITRALGPEAAVDVDTWTFPAQAGDVFLLCSDGLTSMVDEPRIVEVLRDTPDLGRAGQALIDEANQRGGRDNITVVLFRLEDVAGAAPADEAPEQPTAVGMQAPSTDEVRAAAAASEPEAAREPRPRRTAPLPPRPAPTAAAPPEPARRRRMARLLVVLMAVAAVAAGGWLATRAVYFVGTDANGFVTVYQGLPYEGPVGLRLYERAYESGVPATEIPAGRRGAILDHRLRSRDDARDLVRKLELKQVG
ncbi:MAG: Stp1/IreP family PP2C-type Ser/Thr phosphatase [Solirubrobacteraceae bacterium]